MKWNIGAKIGTGFGMAMVVMVTIGAVSYHSTNKLVETAEWVTHTHQVTEQLDGLLVSLINCETGKRGFIITGQQEYLQPYEESLVKIEQSLKEVRTLTRDNARQQQSLDALEPLIRQKLVTMKEGIEYRRSKEYQVPQQLELIAKEKASMDELRQRIAAMKDEEVKLLAIRAGEAQSTADGAKLTIAIGTVTAFILVLAASFFITRSITGPLRKLTDLTKKVAEGELSGDDFTARSRDEVGDLTAAFSSMRGNLREMATQIRQATENVNSTAAEMLAATQQQAAAVKEQAATIQQMTTTMEEITQSGGQISDRAKGVSSTVEAAAGATERGMKATQDTSQTMEAIRDQVEEVAENVVGLSERTQTIGEIIATVSEIAEQSNLLALNASIEAVSAGEHGGRFGVVAHEMKNLADRAKDCTVQVRTILGEIQKGINTSVMLTEEAVKRAEGGKSQAHATETTIREVTSTNEESLQAFQQIVAGANQQQIGVTQVTQGMQDIRQAIKQTAASTSQLEKAAANMNALSQQLHRAVERYRV